MGWLDRSQWMMAQPPQWGAPRDPRTGQPFDPNAPMQPQGMQPPRAPRPTAPQPPMPGQPAAPMPAAVPFSSAPMQMAGAQPAMPEQSGQPFDFNAAFNQPERQPQPGDVATDTGQEKKGGWLSRIQEGLGGLNGTDMLQVGLSLLGESQDGGNWGEVGQDLMRIQQGAMQRTDRERGIKREDEADARAKEEFEAWRAEQKRIQGMDDRYNAALQDPTLDEESKRLLGIMGPQGYGQYELWRAEQSARTEEREADRALTKEENALDRASRLEEARMRAANENSFGRYFQAMDAETIGKANSEAAQIQSRGLPQLQAVKADIEKAKDLAGKTLGVNTRITLGRIFQGSTGDRAALETWRARVLGPALEQLRGLGAMSEREMEAAINAFSNPDMTYEAAMELLDERIRLAENKLLENRAMNEFFTEAGGLTGKRNKSGQDWNSYLSQQFEADRAAREPKPDPAKASEAKSWPTPNRNAVSVLKSDQSAAAKQEFDEIYGPGAADRVLAPKVSALDRREDVAKRYDFGGF